MRESKLSIAIIQLMHFFIDGFNMSYVFLFNPIYDIFFVTWILSQTIHWGLLQNECIVSYIEKKLINPKYKLGENPKWIPHYDVYYNKYLIILKSILILGGLSYIIARSKTNNVKLISVIAIILWMYFTYIHTNSQL